MKYFIAILVILFVFSCGQRRHEATSITASIGVSLKDGGTSSKMVDQDGRPVDSNTVLLPAPGRRTCFIYDGERWIILENTVGIKSIPPYLVSIFEFTDAEDTSLKIYDISRVTCTHKQLRELQVKLWDCKRFASNGAEWEDNEDSITRFPIYIKGNRMNCGKGDFTGTLPDLMKEVEKFFSKNKK